MRFTIELLFFRISDIDNPFFLLVFMALCKHVTAANMLSKSRKVINPIHKWIHISGIRSNSANPTCQTAKRAVVENEKTAVIRPACVMSVPSLCNS